jgi:hypothetical protein
MLRPLILVVLIILIIIIIKKKGRNTRSSSPPFMLHAQPSYPPRLNYSNNNYNKEKMKGVTDRLVYWMLFLLSVQPDQLIPV